MLLLSGEIMVPEFSLHHFRFHLEPKAQLHMPAYNKGNVIRGGFGSTFRRIVCHANCREPETCDLRFVCPYTAVFNPFVPEGSEKISKNRDIPRPFVIKPPLETKETYVPGARLSFDLVVVGKAKDYLPYFIVTFKELCQFGLGRGRTACTLAGVESVSPGGSVGSVYLSSDNTVRPPSDSIRWPDLLPVPSNNGKKEIRRIKLRFLTPTTLKADGLMARKVEFSHLIKRLRDRINALGYFYCGEGLDIDFKALGKAAEEVTTIRDSTAWISSSRYSRRRDVSHDLSGFVGEVVFEGRLEPFLPYLKLGEYLHVGKNAVFGNGWFRIEEIE
jgi:CRISPR-associated endoribonuclease Cas6